MCIPTHAHTLRHITTTATYHVTLKCAPALFNCEQFGGTESARPLFSFLSVSLFFFSLFWSRMAVGGPDRMELICSDDYRNVKTMEIGRRLSLCRFSGPCEITWWQTDDGERWNCGGVGDRRRTRWDTFIKLFAEICKNLPARLAYWSFRPCHSPDSYLIEIFSMSSWYRYIFFFSITQNLQSVCIFWRYLETTTLKRTRFTSNQAYPIDIVPVLPEFLDIPI